MNIRKSLFCIGETFALNCIIYFVFFHMNYNQGDYLELNPHPLLLICIAMGIRYGSLLGLISALVSSVFYSYAFFALYEDMFLMIEYWINYKYLLLFFWSSLIVGTFKDNHKLKVEKILNEKTLIQNKYKKLEETHRLTEKVKEELKKQVINSEESMLNLYDIASKLETFELESIYTETIGILSKYLKADSVSIYTYNEKSGYLRLKIKIGDYVNESRTIQTKDSEGFSRVVLEKKAVRLIEAGEDNFPLMSAPLIRQDKVIAIINVESMEFENLSEYAYQLFKVIIDWVNKALEQAQYVNELRDSSNIEGTEVMEYNSFKERVKEEERREKEFGMEYAIIKYKLRNTSIEKIGDSVRKALRDVDILGYNKLENMIYILLPATPKEKTPLVEERLIDKLDDVLEKVDPGLEFNEKKFIAAKVGV